MKHGTLYQRHASFCQNRSTLCHFDLSSRLRGSQNARTLAKNRLNSKRHVYNIVRDPTDFGSSVSFCKRLASLKSSIKSCQLLQEINKHVCQETKKKHETTYIVGLKCQCSSEPQITSLITERICPEQTCEDDLLMMVTFFCASGCADIMSQPSFSGFLEIPCFQTGLGYTRTDHK